jgi:ATP-dependent DNA helicase RecG
VPRRSLVPSCNWVPHPDRRFDTTDLRDPLFRLIRRAQAAILDDLPKGFALVNALMHRSYRSHSPVQIIRYANRLAETKGSGIRVMRESMEQAGLTPPLFESDRGNDQFVARYFFHHFLGTEDIAWLAQFKDLHLSEDEAKALIVVREAGALNNGTYRELTKVDTLTASQSLRRLRDAGLLAQKGRGSATYYVPTESLVGSGLCSNPEALSSESDGLSTKTDSLSTKADALSTRPDSLSAMRANAQDAPRKTLLNELPGALAARVGAIGQRHPPGEVCDAIVEICRLRDWRAEELATLLQRHSRYVRNNYLRPLMRNERLEMTSPDEPSDPHQAYRAVDGLSGKT